MKKKKVRLAAFLTAAAAILTAVGCGQNGSSLEKVKASGNMIEKTIDLPEDTLKVSAEAINTNNSHVNIIITTGNSRKCTIEADDNVMELISVNVDEQSGKIVVEGDKTKMFEGMNYCITIDAPVTGVEVSGAYEVDYNCGELSDIDIHSSGACMIHAIGKCENCTYNLAGSTQVDAFDLVCKNINIEASGSVSANIYASESISAEATGACTIIYDGNPEKVDNESSGAVTFKAK